jgi:hypothetical protein
MSEPWGVGAQSRGPYGGQSFVARVPQDQILGCHPGLDVGAAVGPVVRIVFGDRPMFANRQCASAAGEYEFTQIGRRESRVENVL